MIGHHLSNNNENTTVPFGQKFRHRNSAKIYLSPRRPEIPEGGVATGDATKLLAPERVYLLYPLTLRSRRCISMRWDAVHLFANCDAPSTSKLVCSVLQDFKVFVSMGFRCCHELSGSPFLAAASQPASCKTVVCSTAGWALQFAR